jgi:hypothetical protein
MKAVFLTLVLCIFLAGGLWAQGCALCSKTASDLGQNGAEGLNNGILYLAAIPVAFIGTVGFLWWRRNHGLEESGE